MNVRPAEPRDREQWLGLRQSLWPDHSRKELESESSRYFLDGTIWTLPIAVFVYDRKEGALGAFVEISLRPLARGCLTSPVGFIEGWYVDPDLRRRGIGRALIEAAEQWARGRGCTEIGSDRVESNLVSREAHLALGYRPTDRCQLFSKRLTSEPPTPANDWIGLVPMGLDASTAVGLVSDPTAGGIAVFLGTTRAETNASGQALVALDYEAYGAMAVEQLRDLGRRARQRWPIVRLALLHRTGRVALGEPSVLIAVSTPHRANAFKACRGLIDSVKAEAAIWKKEIWADGTGTWVHPETEGDNESEKLRER